MNVNIFVIISKGNTLKYSNIQLISQIFILLIKISCKSFCFAIFEEEQGRLVREAAKKVLFFSHKIAGYGF